jgi:PKD repeat protein
MNKILFSILAVAQIFAFNAQKTNTFDPSNAREGEQVEYCITHKKMNQILSNPTNVVIKGLDDAETLLNQKKSIEKGIIYKIPVVFHVLHINGVENISDEQIYDALTILNRDYRKLNPDAANVHAEFQGMPTDVEVEFVLATKAPNGACFKGITRTLNALSYDGADGDAQVTAIKNGNDVFQGNWPGNKYLNIFICGEIGGAAGYTTLPGGWSANQMTNGIWVLHDYVGSIGTSSVGTSRTLTHELGHWLNLSHTWGGNNNPGNTASCSTDDGVSDTPNCIGVTACLLNSNTCNSDNAYWGGVDKRDNVENYMDYSYCSKMFTAGQVVRIRTALLSTNTGRANLWTTANLNATGATGVMTLCAADFTANQTTVCLGEQVQFADDSYNAVTGLSWSFPNGTPSTSTLANPIVSYAQPGLYSVTLTATDGTTNDTELKTNFIRVLPTPSVLPYWEGFESYTSLANLTNWEVTNINNNNAFTIESTTAHSGTKCAKLVNFGQAPSNIDELISAPIDLSVIPSTGIVTLSFRYAYRKKVATDYEYLKVFITADCGDNWVQRKTLGGSQLSSTAVSTSWAPSSINDWVTVHMTNVTNAYFTSNFRMKFKFEGEGGNNFYLDDINLYAGAPSDVVVTASGSGLEEVSNGIDFIELFPNPADDEVNLKFTAASQKDVVFEIVDLTGKSIQKHLIKAAQGNNLVMFDTKSMAAGSYFVKFKTEGRIQTLQFVIK